MKSEDIVAGIAQNTKSVFKLRGLLFTRVVMILKISWLVIGVAAQAGAISCEDVNVMPDSVSITTSKDTGTPLLDVHTF